MAKCAAWGTIANREEAVRKLVKKLGAVEQLNACYEAGPTGFDPNRDGIWDMARRVVEK
ncbi:MAG: hypothetical protein WCE63_21310 [Acidobacteriaceae bacterium]